MTSPIEDITVQCPKCGNLYEDWYRGSVNLDLDPFDDEYLDQCSSATCPECQHKVTCTLGGHPNPGQSQLVDATNRLNTSDGFIQPNVCRGRLLSWRATAFNSARV